MAVSINWATKVITVLQSDLSALGGSGYALDIDWFRLQLKDLEDSDEGIIFPQTHNHVAPITVGGVTLARIVEIINGYTVSFEDTGTPYYVRLDGANSNIADVANLITNVSIRSNNSAGLVQISGSGGATTDEIWNEPIEGAWTARQMMRIFGAVLGGKVSGGNTATETFRDLDDLKDRVTVIVDSNGNRTSITLDGD